MGRNVVMGFAFLGASALQSADALGQKMEMGTAFTYQGRLTDGDETADGSYDFQFGLYDDPNAGNLVALTTRDDVEVTGGLFTVDVDFGSGAFDGNGRWLEIGVTSGSGADPYTILDPRQRVAPTPNGLALPGLWSQQPENPSDPPNIIGGFSGNIADPGVVGATISGGGELKSENRVTDDGGTIGGGRQNQAGDNAGSTADQPFDTVGGGIGNTAGGFGCTIGGGVNNITSDNMSTVGGGFDNTATSAQATVGGGSDNTASNSQATVAGGRDNTAGGGWSTVPGGRLNAAQGEYSFAAGRMATASHCGAFVWADSDGCSETGASVSSERQDQFRIRANGGARFDDGTEWVDLRDDGTDLITTSTGAHLTLGGIWTDSSDESRKSDFASVDARRVVERLAVLPISIWRHKPEGPDVRHMGPTAQDFYAAFGLGNDNRHIAPLDTAGVALAAIQGLCEILEEKEARIAQLEGQNSDLETRVASLEAVLARHGQSGKGGVR